MFDLKDVTVCFQSESNILAVDHVSLSMEEGSKTAIIGETGSGKSVLLLAILGLLPKNAAVSGNILLDGEDLLKADKKRIREIRGGIISYVPQGGGASMNPLLKVGFQVGEPLMEHRGYSKKAAEKDSIGLLKRFNVGNEEKIAKAYPHMLSGGMRQRAMVAMGISAGPRIILADEPTKGLDERRIRMVADALNQLKEETLLCVTHDMKFAKAVGDKISVMYAAQQLEYVTAAQVLEHPLHPYTQDMIRAMPENGMKCEGTGFALSHTEYEAETGCRYRKRCAQCREICKKVPPVIEFDGHRVRCWKYAADNGKTDQTI